MRGKEEKMELIINQRHSDGSVYSAQSADGRYSWFCGQDGYIHDSEAGRSIYQMAYLKTSGFGSDPLPADVVDDVRGFWAALRAAEHVTPVPAVEPVEQISDADFLARRQREQAFDAVHNEGGEGFNPYRAA